MLERIFFVRELYKIFMYPRYLIKNMYEKGSEGLPNENPCGKGIQKKKSR